MKNTSKRNRAVFTAVLFLCSVCLGIFAISASASEIGYAGAVLEKDVTLTKTHLFGRTVALTEGDVKCTLDIADFKSVTVTSLPASNEGTLTYNGRRVSVGQTVKRRNVEGLKFEPANAEVSEAHFTLTVKTETESTVQCRIRYLDRVNYAPKIGGEETVSVSTKQDVSYFGNLPGKDPEGDVISYRVVSMPENGIVRVNESTGSYRYLPNESFLGEDAFVYVITDEYGNYSKPAEVKIEVTERTSDVEYVDMTDSENYNAALAMTEKNIMAGTLLGDGVYFLPDTEVTRAEFVVMAMKAKGIKQDTSLCTSYFDDNDSIPKSYLGYIATAQKIGIINGTYADGNLLFRPNDTITKYEAAVVLSRLFEQGKDADLTVIAEQNSIPVFARSGVCLMVKAGVFASANEAVGKVNREDTAKYLYLLTK